MGIKIGISAEEWYPVYEIETVKTEKEDCFYYDCDESFYKRYTDCIKEFEQIQNTLCEMRKVQRDFQLITLLIDATKEFNKTVETKLQINYDFISIVSNVTRFSYASYLENSHKNTEITEYNASIESVSLTEPIWSYLGSKVHQDCKAFIHLYFLQKSPKAKYFIEYWLRK